MQLRAEKTLVELLINFKDARNSLLNLVKGEHADQSSSSVNSKSVSKKPKGTTITKKLAQMHFHKQSRDAVKKSLEKLTEGASVHLKTDGDKDLLEKRHKDYIHLHNAQLESVNPLTVEQVVAEVHRRETAKGIEAKKAIKSSSTVEALRNGNVILYSRYCFYLNDI